METWKDASISEEGREKETSTLREEQVICTEGWAGGICRGSKIRSPPARRDRSRGRETPPGGLMVADNGHQGSVYDLTT